MTLSIIWEGMTIAVSHKSNWLNTGYDHIELRADQRLPVTQTGYRSHFMPPEELAHFDSVENFARQWLDGAAKSPEWQKHLKDGRQLSLF